MPLNALIRARTHSLAASLNSHRILIYSIFSIFAVSAAIANALQSHSNFYSVAVYLSKSSRSVLILANFGFLLALLGGHIVQTIFFGALRANEVERLYDRLWFFITESLLAFTIFRDDFDIPFALMFGFLLFVKSFHWLAGDRIEWMDQRPYPGPSLLFHVRMTSLFVILWATDLIMFLIAVESTYRHGVGGMVLFASEYGILMASIANTVSKYLLSAYELRRAGQRGGENAPPWENKSMWTFYIELSTDFLKLTTYLVFFIIIISTYGLPLNIVRDVYITARSFVSRLRALHRYQTATRNMDQRYPNATEEELNSMSDRTCIICREEMVVPAQPNAEDPPRPQSDGPNTTPKKLPCGHVFHFHCLRSWLERQQSCPTCRRTVLETNPPPQTAAGGVPVAPPPQPQGGQQPNPFGLPGAQNQNLPNINNPLGNPLGLVGRLFGPPAHQVGGAQFPPIPAQNPMNGQINAPGMVVHYNIQYQYQLGRQPHPGQPDAPTTQGPLQPPPRFQGFPGPGGVWQPWPAEPLEHPEDGRDDDNGPLNDAPGPNVNARGPDQENSNTLNPREAAVLAALRRSGSQTVPRAGRPTELPTRTTGGNNHDNTANISQASSSAATPSQNTASTSTQSNDVSRNAAPSLIPIYDYNGSGPGVFAPSTTTPGGVNTPASYPRIQLLGRGSQQQQMNGWANPFRGAPPANSLRTPVSQLPPSLTDDQLNVMDRLTREAIDERLRVLEGVSGAVYRCIDELLRMRSTLPPSNPPSHHPQSESSTMGATAVPSTAVPKADGLDLPSGASTAAAETSSSKVDGAGSESDHSQASSSTSSSFDRET